MTNNRKASIINWKDYLFLLILQASLSFLMGAIEGVIDAYHALHHVGHSNAAVNISLHLYSAIPGLICGFIGAFIYTWHKCKKAKSFLKIKQINLLALFIALVNLLPCLISLFIMKCCVTTSIIYHNQKLFYNIFSYDLSVSLLSYLITFLGIITAKWCMLKNRITYNVLIWSLILSVPVAYLVWFYPSFCS